MTNTHEHNLENNNRVPEEGTEFFGALIRASARLLKSPIPVIPSQISKAAVRGAAFNGSAEARKQLVQTASDQAALSLGSQPTLVRKFIGFFTDCEAQLAKEYRLICDRLARMDPTIPVDEDATPLSGLDIATIIMIGLVSIGLISLPLLGIPNYILTYVTDNTILAVSYSVLGFAGVVTLESLSETLQTEREKRRFLRGLCLGSFLALAIWIGLFSISFGGLMFTEPEQLAPSWVGQAMMISGMVAEPLVAASGWITISTIIRSHQPSIDCPLYRKLEKEKRSLGERLARLRALLAELTARKETLDIAQRVAVNAVLASYESFRKQWGLIEDANS